MLILTLKTSSFGFSFPSLPRPDRLWSPPSLLSNRHVGLFLQGWGGRDVKLTSHLHLVPRLGIHGAIPPLTHTSSLCGA